MMRVQPKETKIVTPKPYFEIIFGCSNRSFYGVKNDIYDIAEKIGIEIQDGYITEKCDYEGDLELIIIYDEERNKLFRDSIIEFYGYEKDVANGMSIHLSI